MAQHSGEAPSPLPKTAGTESRSTFYDSSKLVTRVTENRHFASVPTLTAAREMLTFQPLEPSFTAGLGPPSLRIFVRDHKMRELAVGERSLEAHYGRFVLSQSRKGVDEARRLALDVSYGSEPHDAMIAGRAARVYELGPEPAPDDIDGRMPSVVAWHDGEMFFLIASGEMPVEALIPIAASMYDRLAAETHP